ncbi:MAG: hypothetical protein K0S32_1978 [Bacteroidetes bacterium]|jgi:hypothetical protein|nr:hypothetical protein [Bacteroidota bacterium]
MSLLDRFKAMRSLSFKKRMIIFVCALSGWFVLSVILTVCYSDTMENIFRAQEYWYLLACFVLVTSTSLFNPLK